MQSAMRKDLGKDMAKEESDNIKLQLAAGKRSGSPVGTALAHGRTSWISASVQRKTQKDRWMIFPCWSRLYADVRLFIPETPPASVLLLRAGGDCQGSPERIA